MNKRESLRFLADKCSKLLKEKYHVKKIFLTGSLVKGTIHKKSDIDLVVDGLPSDLYIKALTELWYLMPAGIEINLIPYFYCGVEKIF